MAKTGTTGVEAHGILLPVSLMKSSGAGIRMESKALAKMWRTAVNLMLTIAMNIVVLRMFRAGCSAPIEKLSPAGINRRCPT